jgi:hypothetical protein
MTLQKWETLYSTLRILTQTDWIMLPKSTAADIDHFEVTSGLLLPESYRGFVTVFGAGELAYEYDVSAPGYPSSSEWWDLRQFSQQVKAYFDDVAEYYENSDLVSRLWYFASSKGRLSFGWDVTDIRSEQAHEYAIFEVSPSDEPVLVATSFADFVQSVCLADAGLDEDRQVFCPAHVLASEA